jgi:hypothetical protein
MKSKNSAVLVIVLLRILLRSGFGAKCGATHFALMESATLWKVDATEAALRAEAGSRRLRSLRTRRSSWKYAFLRLASPRALPLRKSIC